jgi:hypothetical protein
MIPLLGIYPKEPKSGHNKDTCTPMFIAAQFTMPKLWNNPDALQLMNGSRKKNFYMYSQIYI